MESGGQRGGTKGCVRREVHGREDRSQVVADGTSALGLALFAYPLHPPGRPDRLRNEHLSAIKVPTLFCSGTRDAFASSVELETAGSLLEAASLPFIAGADHGFNVPKSSGLTQEDVWKEALSILVPFVKSVSTN